ncbi:MAG: DUF3099 domain-containing protein [Candidatus Nanopelagicales bacterium]|jgi:hypothetical protein
MSGNEQVHSITGARQGLRDDQAPRTRKYLISMGIRTGCVIGAIMVPGWPRWILLAGAVILPYLAVVIANAGRERHVHTPIETVTLPKYRAITPTSTPTPHYTTRPTESAGGSSSP